MCDVCLSDDVCPRKLCSSQTTISGKIWQIVVSSTFHLKKTISGKIWHWWDFQKKKNQLSIVTMYYYLLLLTTTTYYYYYYYLLLLPSTYYYTIATIFQHFQIFWFIIWKKLCLEKSDTFFSSVFVLQFLILMPILMPMYFGNGHGLVGHMGQNYLSWASLFLVNSLFLSTVWCLSSTTMHLSNDLCVLENFAALKRLRHEKSDR